MAEPYYATVAALRAEPDVADTDPPSDATLVARLQDAEDLIDRILGRGGIDTTTGRVLTPANLAAWQAAKLERATVKVAAVLVDDPQAFAPPRADSIEGPVFKLSGLKAGATPAGETALRAAVALLDQAGLRAGLTGRAVV